MSETQELANFNAMTQAIAVCVDVDEVKDLHDKALALELYAKVAMNVENERSACEVRLRAERRAGELLVEKEKSVHTGVPATVAGTSEYREALESSGINERTAQRWQELAGVSDDVFESALATPTKPSTRGILKSQKCASKMDDGALWLWGRLRDFEGDGLIERDPSEMVSLMTETMRADCRRIAPMVAQWLKEIG